MRRALLVAALLAGVYAHGAAAGIARPDPVFVSVNLDYVNPLPPLTPLRPAVIPAALADQRSLAYASAGDLGGFVRARVGEIALSSGGRSLVGGTGVPEIPQFALAAGGEITSFALAGAPQGEGAAPADNGVQPVPGLERPTTFLPPRNDNRVPPPNAGFGGKPKPRPAPKPSGGGSCGTAGLTIESDHATCRIVATNMEPGDAAAEELTITNSSGEPFALSLRTDGAPNRLWTELRLGVWEVGTPAPQPLPPLLWWTTQDNELTTLQPGQSVRYRLELFLPPAAGNDVQALVASIDFIWRATT